MPMPAFRGCRSARRRACRPAVIGPGRVYLTGRRVRLAQESGVFGKDRAPARDRTGDDRHVGVVAIADPDGLAVLEVDALEAFDERRDEVTPRLLAVGHDVDARAFLVGDRQTDGVALAFLQ